MTRGRGERIDDVKYPGLERPWYISTWILEQLQKGRRA